MQSGRLSLIGNDELRRDLASVPSRYDDTTASELYDQDTTRNVVIPFLSTHSSLGQIGNTATTGRPGTGQSISLQTYPVAVAQDHSGLLHDPEFLGILVLAHWNHSSALRAYESLRAAIENSIRLIDLELNN